MLSSCQQPLILQPWLMVIRARLSGMKASEQQFGRAEHP